MPVPVAEFRRNIRQIQAQLPDPCYIVSQVIPYVTNPTHKGGVIFKQNAEGAAWRIAEGTHRPCTAEEIAQFEKEQAEKVAFYKQQAIDTRMKEAVVVTPQFNMPTELADAMTKALAKK